MEIAKIRYEAPELEELAMDIFTTVAGASQKTDEVGGDTPEGELDF